MGAVESIAENLLAAGIGSGLVAGWRVARTRRGSKYTRAMWAPFLNADSCIIEGTLSPAVLYETLPASVPPEKRDLVIELLPFIERHLADQESSGLMGRGDHEAIVRIQAGLARVGLRAVLPVKSADSLGEERRKNLIVVGGPDVNSVTKDLLARLRCGVTVLQNDNNRNAVRDLVHGQNYLVASDATEIRDYGILVKAPSPYQEGRHVIITAGAHGYGCIAAGHLAVTAERHMYRLSRDYPQGFECVVYHRRSRDSSNVAEENAIVLERPIGGGS
ncbi:hypothetical protein AB0K00_48535 [Dactylosporangium sp. NPDC049525]|uniref:hypothetical protein n=1 Tax=Dactylosporangium sp. NPDC049525 TaxID=3154730 RepID=UPI003443901C